LLPSIRSSKSNPKLWVVIKQLIAIVRLKVIRFMKPRLPVAHAFFRFAITKLHPLGRIVTG